MNIAWGCSAQRARWSEATNAITWRALCPASPTMLAIGIFQDINCIHSRGAAVQPCLKGRPCNPSPGVLMGARPRRFTRSPQVGQHLAQRIESMKITMVSYLEGKGRHSPVLFNH